MTPCNKWLSIKVARARLGLTQHQLAPRAGLSESKAAKLETLRQRPTAEELVRLATSLGLDAEELARDLP